MTQGTPPGFDFVSRILLKGQGGVDKRYRKAEITSFSPGV
jgi:hypothetical protein